MNLRRVFAAMGLTMGIALTTALESQHQPSSPLIVGSMTGAESFAFYCASCHGASGKGDGRMRSTLKTRPTDLTSLARRNGGVFPRDRILAAVSGDGRQVDAHGSREMPIWGPVFRGLEVSEVHAKQRIENLVAHIESMQQPSTAR